MDCLVDNLQHECTNLSLNTYDTEPSKITPAPCPSRVWVRNWYRPLLTLSEVSSLSYPKIFSGLIGLLKKRGYRVTNCTQRLFRQHEYSVQNSQAFDQPKRAYYYNSSELIDRHYNAAPNKSYWR